MQFDAILNSGRKFFSDMQSISNGRYRSWEHCRTAFVGARSMILDENVIDMLCLHLSFYLASWGMYRGSSFLLQRDYKVHAEIINVLYKQEYSPLWSFNVDVVDVDKNIVLLLSIRDEIKIYYSVVRNSVYDEVGKCPPKNDISDILISKILLGTIGCVPAFDRLFVDGIKSVNGLGGLFESDNIKALCSFYCENMESLEHFRREISSNIEYTQMKVLDMCFWQVGYEKDRQKQKK